ncbi:D-alanine--D-alanyl carrier protein ligase [Seminavis robusta]|uniref:D-alanine--D-alanyl carrier protein ligase n=1 Tax=Seminavis robusta TaxID=568900 RepID=A0A9N8DL97_9STRA|nr:D-alanine--D-alanyl carrier protein ligase [Seminavis robusta]|eukprot:Sro193_g082610.1 D-alanine--D-alanyl carrier protein ligase (1625) ;mRNA; f:65599-70930
MPFFHTILEALCHHATESPNKVVFTWVDLKCKEQNKMTFKQLEEQSNTVAACLLKLGCQKGDRVMVAYPFGLEFLAGMFGAMKIGVIPCSIYPPNPNQLKTDMPKFHGFAKDAGARFALSTSAFAAAMTAASVLYRTGVKWIGADKLKIKNHNPNKPKDYETFVGEPGDICFIQYTSGSTGRPKGEMISHNNLGENCRTIGASTQMTSTSVTALWVPQYHDMGLVGGFMSCLYSGVTLVMTSPLDFLSKPIIWSDMIDAYQATHTCAPNFAYALLLKRLKEANRTADWSFLKFAGFSAEPTQQRVVEDVVKTLSVRPGNVHNLYGLAESVVWLTGGPAIPDSEGLVCCGEVDSPTLKIRIVQDGKEVEGGQVGSIWTQSPRVAAGYFGQPELTTATFANELSGYDGPWLDIGDLGRVVDGQLYVTGRVKDVIIINGKNYYPTDVESSMDDAFGDIIRPGRTTAFQYGEDSIGITVEARKGFDMSVDKDLAIQVSNHVSELHGLFVCEVVVLKIGVTPKTTSGIVTEAVQAIECIPAKLDDYYYELNLDGIHGICEAWSKAVKTTAAMKTMCSQILIHIENKQPTICQPAHTLSENTDWILIEETMDFLSQLVHQVFVLQWVTTFMMDHPECMQQKLQKDAEWESMSQSILAVPVELQKVLDLPEKDPMHGKWPFFMWIKIRSVGAFLKLIHKSLESPDDPAINTQIERINKLLNLNLLEAIWLEQTNGLKDNSEVGRLLATYPILEATVKSKTVLFEHSTSVWNDLYIAWNMHFVSWIGDQDSSTWLLAKLLLPSLVGDVKGAFLYARVISLYLASHTIGRRMSSSRHYTKAILSRRALQVFGELNLSWAQKLGNTPPSARSKVETASNEAAWLSKFDLWGKMNNPVTVDQAHAGTLDTNVDFTCREATDCFSEKYTNTITSVFGSEVDTSKSWAENGLTSLKSAEFRNKVEEELHVVLPVNFEQLYTTPEALCNFLELSEVKTFKKQDLAGHRDLLRSSPRSSLRKLHLGVLQTIGSIMILLLVLIAFVPPYLLISWVVDKSSSADTQSPIAWIIMPLMFRLYILSFSLDVAFFKFVVIGSAKIESFIREFDLVTLGDNTVISHPMKCRKFSRSKGEPNPKIGFYPIVVGKKCKISGMVSPGAVIGDGSKVDKLSVVEEGAIVPDGVLAQGNPAYNAGLFEHQELHHLEESMLETFKIFWTVLEAYHFFALSCFVHASLSSVLPAWRYATMLHWILLFPISSLLALFTSIALKWVLIGKRDPSDEYEGSLYRKATNWACDFHFRIAAWNLAPFSGQSRLWNLILFLRGLDIDMESWPDNPYFIFPPSKADFVKIRKSFVATISLDFSRKGNSKIEIINSSVGYNVNLHAGVKIMQSTVPPRTNVPDSIYDLNQLGQPVNMNLLLPEVLQVLLNTVLFVSLIPAYELGLVATKSSSIMVTTCGLVGAFILQLLVWLLLTGAVERLLLALPNQLQYNLFGIYLNHVWIFRNQNLLVYLLYGTPMFAWFASFMGAEVDGELWYFGNTLYEYGKLHFHGCTVIDGSSLNGHYIDGKGLTINDTYVSGVVHPGCFAVAGSKVAREENGPWKVFLNTGADIGSANRWPSIRKQSPSCVTYDDENVDSAV